MYLLYCMATYLCFLLNNDYVYTGRNEIQLQIDAGILFLNMNMTANDITIVNVCVPWELRYAIRVHHHYYHKIKIKC